MIYCLLSNIWSFTHTHMHKHTHTHTHICIHTHTCVCMHTHMIFIPSFFKVWFLVCCLFSGCYTRSLSLSHAHTCTQILACWCIIRHTVMLKSWASCLFRVTAGMLVYYQAYRCAEKLSFLSIQGEGWHGGVLSSIPLCRKAEFPVYSGWRLACWCIIKHTVVQKSWTSCLFRVKAGMVVYYQAYRCAEKLNFCLFRVKAGMVVYYQAYRCAEKLSFLSIQGDGWHAGVLSSILLCRKAELPVYSGWRLACWCIIKHTVVQKSWGPRFLFTRVKVTGQGIPRLLFDMSVFTKLFDLSCWIFCLEDDFWTAQSFVTKLGTVFCNQTWHSGAWSWARMLGEKIRLLSLQLAKT